MTTGGASEAFWKNSIAPSRLSCNGGNKSEEPEYFDDYDKSIEKVADKRHPCKFLFSDGTTASYAINGQYCGKLVKTGKATFSAGQGFILPKDSMFTEELSKGILSLAMEDKLVSLDEFYEREGLCPAQHPSSKLSIRKLSLFFIMAYTVCCILLLVMMLDRPKHDGNELQSQHDPENSDSNDGMESI